MKKAVFWIGLVVMTANVFGMNNVVDPNGTEKGNRDFFKHRLILYNQEESRIRKAINEGDEKFFYQLYILYVQGGSILVKWKKKAIAVLKKWGYQVPEKADEISENDLVKSLLDLRDKQEKQDQKINFNSKVISDIKHVFDSKFLCLANIRSKMFNNEMYLFLLMYKNKIPVDAIELHRRIDDKMKNFFTYAIKPDPLHAMVEANKKDLLKIMIEYGADVNKIVNNHGETLLFTACESRNLGLVKYLIEQGADVNKENDGRKTPLFAACKSRNIDIVKYLIEQGADVNKVSNYDKTPLFEAYESGNIDIVKYLIEQGADVNKEDTYGETLLFEVCESGNIDIVKYLIEQGVDVNKVSNYDKTPLDLSYRYKYGDLIEYLEGKGALRGNEINDRFLSTNSNEG